jgi:hypothetical protein
MTIISIGTKSLLLGVHQCFWHPFTVLLAWIELYGFPNWKELICIIIHDWGYWGCKNMDGEEGEMHPRYAAILSNKWLDGTPGREYSWEGTYSALCLLHSRHYARHLGATPSKLCWADKLSIKYDPWWFYLPRALLSGELQEYRALHASMGENFKTHRDWYNWAAGRAIRMGKQQSSEGISFHPFIQVMK